MAGRGFFSIVFGHQTSVDVEEMALTVKFREQL